MDRLHLAKVEAISPRPTPNHDMVHGHGYQHNRDCGDEDALIPTVERDVASGDKDNRKRKHQSQ
jgi:hypothetical protein